jgi:hypothetical protein
MGKINWGRVILCGLLAGIVWGVLYAIALPLVGGHDIPGNAPGWPFRGSSAGIRGIVMVTPLAVGMWTCGSTRPSVRVTAQGRRPPPWLGLPCGSSAVGLMLSGAHSGPFHYECSWDLWPQSYQLLWWRLSSAPGPTRSGQGFFLKLGFESDLKNEALTV